MNTLLRSVFLLNRVLMAVVSACLPRPLLAQNQEPTDLADSIPKSLRGVPDGVASNRVRGTAEPPPPYRVEAALPEHPIYRLVTFRFEPGTGKLVYVHQPANSKNTLLMRYDLKSGNTEKLLDVDEFIYGVAFHPDYAKNGFIYLGTNGPVSAPSAEHRALVVRYTLQSGAGSIDPGSALEILSWPSKGHNGTALTFGSDGMLYVTSGDGTGDSDTDLAGQRLDHLLAKVLRINVDRPDSDRPYSIPADNPFVHRLGARPETWAYGLRNPWRSSWDPVLHRLWVGQNGQDRLEQVYLVEKGANYGWSVVEGSQPFYESRTRGPDPISPPTLEHLHHESRSLTGGEIYTGSQLPELRGAYVYGDYATGKIWAARHDGQRVTWHQKIAESRLGLTDFVTTPEGALWVAHYQAGPQGGLFRLSTTPPNENHTDFPRKLSETGLFQSISTYEVERNLMPYSVNVPEWADGTLIRRHIALPAAGGKIQFSPQRGWELPEGAVVLQSFATQASTHQNTPPKWIETRILTRQNGEWSGYSYAWNLEQTDAFLVREEGSESLINGMLWRFPSRADCGNCHSRAANFLLGLQTGQMNKHHDYGEGFSGNQLEVMAALGVFAKTGSSKGAASVLSPPASKQEKLVDPWDESNDLGERARSYLHATCAHCHVESGGGNSQMDLRSKIPTSRMKILHEIANHGTAGLPADARLVVPGFASQSVMVSRVARSTEGRMPPLGSTTPDPRAARLLVEWITALKDEAPTPPPSPR